MFNTFLLDNYHVRRRTYLQSVAASTSLLGIAGAVQAKEGESGNDSGTTPTPQGIEVLKGTPNSPVSSTDIEKANQNALKNSPVSLSKQSGTKSTQRVVPVPNVPENRETVSYMVGTTPSGQVKYFHGTVPKSKLNEKATKANHRKMEQYVSELSGTSSYSANSVELQSTCSGGEVPSMAQMDGSKEAVEGFGCPQIGGRRIDEGVYDGSDSYEDTMPEGEVTVEENFYLDYLDVDGDPEASDQWCGAITAIRVTPGCELTDSDAKDEFVLGFCKTEHNWDQNAYMHPEDDNDDQGQAIYGTMESSLGTEITSVSVSVGKGSFGFGVGWSPQEKEITTSVDSSRAKWDVNYTEIRKQTSDHTWASVCQYEDKAESGDKILTSRVDSQFEDRLVGKPIAFANSHTEVDYTVD